MLVDHKIALKTTRGGGGNLGILFENSNKNPIAYDEEYTMIEKKKKTNF